jgi:hypothetical protein
MMWAESPRPGERKRWQPGCLPQFAGLNDGLRFRRINCRNENRVFGRFMPAPASETVSHQGYSLCSSRNELQPTPRCHRLPSVESPLSGVFDSLCFRGRALSRPNSLVSRRVPSGRAVCRGRSHRHLQAFGRPRCRAAVAEGPFAAIRQAFRLLVTASPASVGAGPG